VKAAVFLSIRQKSTNLAGSIDRAILSLGKEQTVNLWRFAPDNSSSSRVVTRKWLLKNEKLPTRLKPGPVGKLKTIKETMNSHWSDHRHNTKILERVYLKSLLPLTPSVEKLSFIFMGSSKFTKQEIRMYYLVTVNRNNMAVRLTRSDCEGLVEVMYIHCSGWDWRWYVVKWQWRGWGC